MNELETLLSGSEAALSDYLSSVPLDVFRGHVKAVVSKAEAQAVRKWLTTALADAPG